MVRVWPVSHFAVSAIGADRPGIVVAVTRVLMERGCNLEDTSMSILRGHFAMMLVVAAGPDESAVALEAALVAATAPMELVVTVRPLQDGVPPVVGGAPWTVSVYGADRPGIVHQVASVLADMQINIVDLSTHVIGEESQPVYAMLLDVSVPASVDGDAMVVALANLEGISCRAHPVDTDIL
jgi:glycine cleavage system transcriptional repressor